MDSQLSLFGGEISFDDLIKQYKKSKSHKTKTMQEMFGTIEGKTCESCVHCFVYRQSRAWYKCELWNRFFRGRSQASDIRLKHQACTKYKERQE